MKKILILFTGGTIGSVKIPTNNSNGYSVVTVSEAKKRGYSVDNLESLLLGAYREKYGLSEGEMDSIFEARQVMEVLSENMTVDKWNLLVKYLKRIDYDNYSGVIITHGTDTLGYTSNLLSVLLNDVNVPIMLVSSNQTVDNPKANGLYNLYSAIKFIKDVKVPGVYVCYRGDFEHDGILYHNIDKVIYGSRVTQCLPLFDDFDSFDKNPLLIMGKNDSFKVIDKDLFDKLYLKEHNNKNVINSISSLTGSVMQIKPYVGMNYSSFNLDCDCIIHDLYHSGTFCSGLNNEYDVIKFLDRVQNEGKLFYFGPAFKSEREDEQLSMYEGSTILFEHGVKFLLNCSLENAYAKLLVASSLSKKHDDINDFMRSDINFEHIFYRTMLEDSKNKTY